MDAEESISTEVDLAAVASDFVEVSRFQSSGGQTVLCAPSHGERPFRLDSNYPIGEHRVEVLVVSENSGSVRAVVSYITSHEKWISEVRFCETPEKNDVQQVGLIALFEGAGDDGVEPNP
jgi:hypothetical protein